MEAFGYLSYYYMMNDNYAKSKEYYNRMISLNPNNKEYKIKGYNGLGSLETKMAGPMKRHLKEGFRILQKLKMPIQKFLLSILITHLQKVL